MADAPRYRDFVRPALVDTSRPGSGAASASESLAAAFKAFETTAADLGAGIQARKGARQGAEAGASGDPQFRRGFFSQTAYAQAYNDAAMRSYAVRAQADLEDTAARLEVEAANDPEKFRATFGKVQVEVLKAAPAEARGLLTDAYNKRLAQGVTRLRTAQVTELRERSRVDTAEGIERSIDRIARLRSEDTEDAHREADEEEVRLQLLIDGAGADGTLTATEAQAAHIRASRQITHQTVVARFRKELENPYGDPIRFIQRLKKANETSEALSPEEEQKLEADLFAELREHNALADAGKQAEIKAKSARWEEGERSLTEDLLAGRLTLRRLLQAAEDDEADPAVLRTLRNELTEGDTPKSDPQTLFDYETDLLNKSDDEIKTERGLTWADRSRLLLKKREWESGWRGTQQGREAAQRIDRALGIPPGLEGRLLSGDVQKQRERALTEWYDAVDALPAAERQFAAIRVAEEVIGRVIKNTAREALEKARRNLDNFRKAPGDVAKLDDYNRKIYDDEVARLTGEIEKAELKAK